MEHDNVLSDVLYWIPPYSHELMALSMTCKRVRSKIQELFPPGENSTATYTRLSRNVYSLFENNSSARAIDFVFSQWTNMIAKARSSSSPLLSAAPSPNLQEIVPAVMRHCSFDELANLFETRFKEYIFTVKEIVILLRRNDMRIAEWLHTSERLTWTKLIVPNVIMCCSTEILLYLHEHKYVSGEEEEIFEWIVRGKHDYLTLQEAFHKTFHLTGSCFAAIVEHMWTIEAMEAILICKENFDGKPRQLEKQITANRHTVIRVAAKYRDIDVVMWLYTRFEWSVTYHDVLIAVVFGRLDIAKWMLDQCQRFPEESDPDYSSYSFYNDKWMSSELAERQIGFRRAIVRSAIQRIESNYLEVLQWAYKSELFVLDHEVSFAYAIQCAIASRRIAVMNWLITFRPMTDMVWTYVATNIEKLICDHRLRFVQYLIGLGLQIIPCYLSITARDYNHTYLPRANPFCNGNKSLRTMQWLYANGCVPNFQTLRDAFEAGLPLEDIKYMMEMIPVDSLQSKNMFINCLNKVCLSYNAGSMEHVKFCLGKIRELQSSSSSTTKDRYDEEYDDVFYPDNDDDVGDEEQKIDHIVSLPISILRGAVFTSKYEIVEFLLTNEQVQFTPSPRYLEHFSAALHNGDLRMLDLMRQLKNYTVVPTTFSKSLVLEHRAIQSLETFNWILREARRNEKDSAVLCDGVDPETKLRYSDIVFDVGALLTNAVARRDIKFVSDLLSFDSLQTEVRSGENNNKNSLILDNVLVSSLRHGDLKMASLLLSRGASLPSSIAALGKLVGSVRVSRWILANSEPFHLSPK